MEDDDINNDINHIKFERKGISEETKKMFKIAREIERKRLKEVLHLYLTISMMTANVPSVYIIKR